MAKKKKTGKAQNRPTIRNAHLLETKKPEIVKESGQISYTATAQKEKTVGKAPQKFSEQPRNQNRGITAKIAEIKAKKELQLQSKAVQQQKEKPKEVQQKPVESPAKNERIQRLKSTSSLSTPAMADRQKMQQVAQKKSEKKGQADKLSSLRQGQEPPKKSPAKRPPTRSR
jgi:hypothetical protein